MAVLKKLTKFGGNGDTLLKLYTHQKTEFFLTKSSLKNKKMDNKQGRKRTDTDRLKNLLNIIRILFYSYFSFMSFIWVFYIL